MSTQGVQQETRTGAMNGKTDGAASHVTEVKAEKPARQMNPNVRRIAMIVGAVVLIAILVWGIRYFLYARTHQSTDDAHVDAQTISVTSKISEQVASINVDTGQYVHKGQLLVQLNNIDEQTRYNQAESALRAQRAQAAAAQAQVSLTQQTVSAQAQESLGGITQAQSSISNASANVGAAQQNADVAAAGITQAQAALPAAQEALAKANADLARTRSLVSTGDLPRQQLDAARAAAAAAQSQYNQSVANVNAAQARYGAAMAQVQGASAGTSAAQGTLQTAQGRYQETAAPARVAASQAQANAAYAQVASMQAQLDLARQQLAYTRIVAPIDGYVGQKNVAVGQTVQPGLALITVIPANNVFVTANYKETQVGDMRVGQPADITVDAYKGVTFHGHVAAINPASQNTYSLIPAQNASGNFIKVTQRIPVKIVFDNPPADKPLRPGMSVETSVKVR